MAVFGTTTAGRRVPTQLVCRRTVGARGYFYAGVGSRTSMRLVGKRVELRRDQWGREYLFFHGKEQPLFLSWEKKRVA